MGTTTRARPLHPKLRFPAAAASLFHVPPAQVIRDKGWRTPPLLATDQATTESRSAGSSLGARMEHPGAGAGRQGPLPETAIAAPATGRSNLRGHTASQRRAGKLVEMDPTTGTDMVVSVIVPVKNGLPWLREQMQALLDQHCRVPWEVIVADNGSSDGSASFVEELTHCDRRLRLVDASSVSGAGATRNLGARFARGAILAFCDADDIVHAGWVESWVDALADADLAGGLTDYWSLNETTGPCRNEPKPPPAKLQFDFLDGTGSGNMAVRRDAFEKIGGFDDLAVGEDIDLCWRLQLDGYRFTVGQGVISRREKSSLSGLLRRSIQFGRCGPVLYQRYRDKGLRREGLSALRAWLYLLVTAPKLVRPDFRRTWVRNAGWRIGRLVESYRRRTFFP